MSNEISNERLEMISKYDTFVSLGEAEAMAKELLALRKAREGWKLVPIEPTEDMLAAAKEWFGLTTTAEGVYEKMLAAAPNFVNEHKA